ncbi:MAG: hypothetical protein WDZ77_01740 [Candidatus Pacearchaeota archaeon]
MEREYSESEMEKSVNQTKLPNRNIVSTLSSGIIEPYERKIHNLYSSDDQVVVVTEGGIK